MSLRTEKDARYDPRPGDALEKDGATRTVIGRGVAGSVKFQREKGGNLLRGAKSIHCWHKWAREATVLVVA